MSRALYRTYRSKSFSEVVGQSHVTELLDAAIKSGKIAHAYLLTGPRGVGKTSVARIIAHAVNGLEYSEDTHLDIIEIDAASNRRIDDIRELREKVHISPVSAKFKVYIIDEVHMLTGESFNALLKTLEEPPEHVIFILATTEVHKVPATIISRTQRYHFKPATVSDTKIHLAEIANREKISVDDDALELIAHFSGGSFRDSVSMLDQLSGLSERVTAELVESVLGMAKQSHIDAIIEAVINQDTDKVITELQDQYQQGVSAVVITDQLNRSLAKLAPKKPDLYELLDELSDVPKAYDSSLKLIATLVRHSKKHTNRTMATHSNTNRKSIVATPAELTTRVQKQKNTAATERASSDTKTQSDAKHSSSTSKITDWSEVLQTVKKHYPPLFSVLSRADMHFEDSSKSLTLRFAYALHRKKLENPTYRKQLCAVFTNLYGYEPTITISDSKSQPMNEEVLSVAAIMGGGEVVNGTI